MNEYEESIADEIRIRIWSGFHSLSDVLFMITTCDESEVDQPTLEEFARSEFQAKRDDEATWPPITDCVLLDEVFDALSSDEIVALQNAGFTMSDGLCAVNVALADYNPDRVRGYCFYHEQDVAGAVEGYGLWLAYGDIANTESGKRAIGELVKAELERRGFIVDWNGNPDTRIKLPKIMWQRLTPDP